MRVHLASCSTCISVTISLMRKMEHNIPSDNSIDKGHLRGSDVNGASLVTCTLHNKEVPGPFDREKVTKCLVGRDRAGSPRCTVPANRSA